MEAAVGSSLACTRYSTPAARRAGGAFTLIELLVVVVIISIVAGLALGTLGYVNRESASSRAQAEIAALSAAIDDYRLDFGSYPSSNNLYSELTGGGPVNTNKVYIEPTPVMATNRGFVDPFGLPYNYNPTTPTRNVGFFDLWTVPPRPEGDPNNRATWIHN